MPNRIQLRRTAGWRKPADTIVVSRPSRWGNPFRVVREPGVGWSLRGIPEERGEWTGIGRELACAYAKNFYYSWITGAPSIKPTIQGLTAPFGTDLESLRGYNLACWCPLEFACHGDVLLELAND